LFYTISLAKELASKEVRVNMVSPGFMENAVDLPDFSALPLKRPAFLKEVAQVVGYFFDSKNAYITGQNIEVAGGVGLA
jgi:NAD(P)-dependent dehydrogenase (short-subunit alcohol dehydrogenase family)